MRKAILMLFVLAAVLATASAWAADTKHVVRFAVNYVSPTGDLSETGTFEDSLGDGTILVFDGTDTFEADSATGIALGYEYRMSDLIGFDFNILWANHDVNETVDGDYQILDEDTLEVLEEGTLAGEATIGDTDMMPLTAGVNFHLLKGGKLDLYLGPFLSYTTFSDIKTELGDLALKSDVSFGAVVGIDVPFGKGGWAFNGALRYLDAQAEPDDAEGGDALDVNPWMVQVGFGYRF